MHRRCLERCQPKGGPMRFVRGKERKEASDRSRSEQRENHGPKTAARVTYGKPA